MYLVTHGDHGSSVSDKIDQKTKNVVDTRFFLPSSFQPLEAEKKFIGGEK